LTKIQFNHTRFFRYRWAGESTLAAGRRYDDGHIESHSGARVAIGGDVQHAVNLANPGRGEPDQRRPFIAIGSTCRAVRAAGGRRQGDPHPVGVEDLGPTRCLYRQHRAHQNGLCKRNKANRHRAAAIPGKREAPPVQSRLSRYWGAYPLSQSDPAIFASWFTPILAQLEESGVVLAGLELGNEINWAPFNGDFPVPGQGKVIGDTGLYSNPEAEVIAAGYRAYMLSLQALRQIRDGSALNQATPVISGGLSNPGAPRTAGVAIDGVPIDAVSINATLNYLRAYGLDTIADTYGIHFYPNANATSAQRYHDLADNALAQCGKYGVSCTVTEWGFRLPSFTCPLNDSNRNNLAYEILSDVANWGSAVRSMVWFDWLSLQYGLYQCGAETATGHLVLGQ